MVHGLVHFSEKLAAFREHYVLIGGVAADLLMSEIGTEFRATKDLDIVVFMRPNPVFLSALANYIKEGNYQNKEKSDGTAQYYRFSKPTAMEFPKQIELFSKKPEDLKLLDDQHIIPIQKVEAGDQFSGILLEDEYYNLIRNNLRQGDSCNYINELAQIPLKSRAFNELRERQARGIPVDDRDIKKHRNDILLMTQALTEGKKIKLEGIALKHLQEYLSELTKLKQDQGLLDFCRKNNLGDIQDLINLIESVYFS